MKQSRGIRLRHPLSDIWLVRPVPSKNCKKIIVVNQGHIVESGEYEVLLKKVYEGIKKAKGEYVVLLNNDRHINLD